MALLAQLRSASIATVADEERGFERHADLRWRGDRRVQARASAFAFYRKT
jgi:hypothetical protein